MVLTQAAERHQPRVENAQFLVAQRRADTTAGGVAAQDDVLDLEMGHRVLDHARRVEIAVVDDVGDVAVHEHIAWLEPQDGGFRAARVGAADPQNLRLLAEGE